MENASPENDRSLLGKTLFFYGRLAFSARRDAERFARERGFRVAATLRETVDRVVLGEGEPLAQVRTRLAAEFDERSRRAFELGTLAVVSETQFWNELAATYPVGAPQPPISAPETPSRRAPNDAFLFPELASPAVVERPEPSAETSLETLEELAATEQFGCTPAALAELVGVSIETVRRWRRRGLLSTTVENGRLPSFSTRAVLVAKRLAFLCSTGLSDEFVERRVAAFREFGPDVESIILRLTLSSDGRDVLLDGDAGPVDFRGQRRFDFGALPSDGSGPLPPTPPFLSQAEEEIALAERLVDRQETSIQPSEPLAPPPFLAFFADAPSATAPSSPIPPILPEPPTRVNPVTSRRFEPSAAPSTRFDFSVSPFSAAEQTTRPVLAFNKEARERWRDATKRRVVRLCESAWNLEREGYWEEAARLYRGALLAGGLDAGVCFRLGKLLYLLGDFSAARERFYATLELDEDFVDARFELAKTLVSLGEFDDAVAAFEGALAERPDDPNVRFELGKLYLRLGRREAAIDELRQAAATLDDEKIADDVRRLLFSLARNDF
ncbi:MAG: tetratricopeptide repeat protein [Thermoguttaceae bacterium]|nr:tetratricopeptide repeat protein [Thermoguttaceae bacterium]